MIRYALICDNAHESESWFASSTGFEEQAARGLVSCPVCGSAKVERAVMAPAVARTDRSAPARQDAAPEAGAGAPAPALPSAAPPSAVPNEAVTLMSEKEVAIRAMVTALHEHVARTAEHVGPHFADEALKIHHGESDSRPIYGEASADDARMLHEEGVEFMALPRLPGARN